MLSPHQSCGAGCSQSSRPSCCGAACGGCHGVSCGASRGCVNHAGSAEGCLGHLSGYGGYGASCQPQPIKRRRTLLSLASSAASTSPLYDEHQHPHQQLRSAQHALMNLENFDEPRSVTGGTIGATKRPTDARGALLRHSGSFSSRRRTGSLRLKAMWRSANTSPVTSVTTQSQSPTVSDEIASISRGMGPVARGVWGGGAGSAGVNGGNGVTRFGGFPSTFSAPNLHALTQTLKSSSPQPTSIKAHPVLQRQPSYDQTLPAQQQQALMQQLLQLQQADPSPSHLHTRIAAHPSGATGAAATAETAGAAGASGALGAASAAVSAMTQQISASTLHGTQRPHQPALQLVHHRPLFDRLWADDNDSLASPACPAEAPAISGAGKRSWGRPVKDTWQQQPEKQQQLKLQQQQQQLQLQQQQQLQVQQEKKTRMGAASALTTKDGLAQLEAFMEASMGRTTHSSIAQEEEDLRSLEAVVMGLEHACLQELDAAGGVDREVGEEKMSGGEEKRMEESGVSGDYAEYFAAAAAAAAAAAPATMNESSGSEHAAPAQDKHAACEQTSLDLDLRL
ncbi:unnamed protein product [Closterium sp. NIES-54]